MFSNTVQMILGKNFHWLCTVTKFQGGFSLNDHKCKFFELFAFTKGLFDLLSAGKCLVNSSNLC